MCRDVVLMISVTGWKVVCTAIHSSNFRSSFFPTGIESSFPFPTGLPPSLHSNFGMGFDFPTIEHSATRNSFHFTGRDSMRSSPGGKNTFKATEVSLRTTLLSSRPNHTDSHRIFFPLSSLKSEDHSMDLNLELSSMKTFYDQTFGETQ